MKYSRGNMAHKKEKWTVVHAPGVSNISAAQTWCKQHPNTSRYYHYFASTRWWFEDPDMALIFALTWSGDKGSNYV